MRNKKRFGEYRLIKWKIKKHKYNATKTEVDGIKFESMKEAEYYKWLKNKKHSEELLFFLRQVPFDLPGNIKYRVDFVEFWADGNVKFVDVKGFKTKEFIKNKKMVENLYPVEIEIV